VGGIGVTLCSISLLLIGTTVARAASDACRGGATVAVSGMACPFCAYGLRKELLTLPNVKEVEVDLKKSQAIVTVAQGSEVKDADIAQAVKKAGFTPGSVQCEAPSRTGQTPAFFKSAEFNVAGMQCENCAASVTAALENQKGVGSATVDLASKRATVSYDPQEVTPSSLGQVIEHAGKFRATLANAPASGD
jgi:copper chaperone CopZ